MDDSPTGEAVDAFGNQPEQAPEAGAEPLESQDEPRQPGDPTGIRIGSLLLRPSLEQRLETERSRAGATRLRRDTLATTAAGTLSSDWSRHALTITGETTLERDIGGNDRRKDIEPETRIDGRLRLDLADGTTANLQAGYAFARDDEQDPNAVGGAASQPGTHAWTGSAALTRELGLIHATAALDLGRTTHTDAKLEDGSTVSMADRDRTGIDGRLRLGYALSPAVIPFAELSLGRTFYDQRRDNAGYARSARRYAARGGVAFDFGEKLNGELGIGYTGADYADSRLRGLGALAVNGNLNWSPRRGTNVELGLRTSLEDSTTAGQSGWAEYQLTANVAQQLRDDLTARLNAGATLRDFPAGTGNETIWVAGAGLAWALNPFLDLTGDVEYEWADRNSGNRQTFRAGVGLRLAR